MQKVFTRAAIVSIVALLSSCRPVAPRIPLAPHVHLVIADGDPNLAAYERAGSAWEMLGFTVSGEDVHADECPRFWYAMHLVSCQITVTLERVPRLVELAKTEAMTNRTARLVRIDAAIAGDRLRVALSHEIGHVLLDTPRHTQGGLMGGATWWLTEVDFALACETIGICVPRK